MPDHNYFSNLIWQIADLLRGPYRPPQYERVMLPMTVLRRFDCVLAPTKGRVLAEFDRTKGGKVSGDALDTKLNKVAGQRFHNHSPLDFEKLKGDPDNINKHLVSYIKGFSTNVQRIFEYFEFESEVEKMHEANILYLVVSKFADVELHPSSVPNEQMGLIFENLIRRFNELANETAGDHFTPREVIRLMVNLLFIHDDKLLATAGTVRKLLDPACGTGGMLAEAQRYLRDHHSEAKLYVYGQDYNKRAFATAASDMLMKEVSHNGGGENVRFGDIFTEDRFTEPPTDKFDYFLSNPPFGVDWKKQQKEIQSEHDKRGFDGRFGAGLPRVNDGALLFLQHMWSKREDVKPGERKEGSRLAIVFSGSPMFTGGAGSGESEIRRWLLENDWLEAIVALPESMFYNTGIGTYVWVVTNRKEKRRKGKVQLLDARDVWTAGGSEDSKRSLGDKRRHMTVAQIDEIVRLYGRFEEGPRSKIFDNADFGYTRVTIERPLRLRYQMTTDDKARFLDACPHLLDDMQAIDKALSREPRLDWSVTWDAIDALLRKRGSRWKATEQKLFRSVFTQRDAKAEAVAAGSLGSDFEADADLRDFENVPLTADVEEHFAREVLPYLPDAWLDRSKDKIGYEVNFSRYFDSGLVARPLQKVDSDLAAAEREVMRLLDGVTRSSVAPNGGRALVDSGVPWIGKIPAHWKVVALRFLVDFVSGGTPNTGKQGYWGGHIPWVSPKDMKVDEIVDAEDHVTDLALSDTTLRMILPRAVLVVVRGMILAHSFPVAVTAVPVTVNQDMKALICREQILPEFLHAFLRGAEKQVVALADTSAHGTKKLETQLLGQLPICVPPLNEQHEIVSRIRVELDAVANLNTAASRVQSLLVERRSAVLAAATTGKVVSGAQA